MKQRRKVNMSKARKNVKGKTSNKRERFADGKHVIMLDGEAKKGNPRRAGTAAGKRHGELQAFLRKKRGKANVKDVYANTNYGSNDLRFDRDAGYVKVVAAR